MGSDRLRGLAPADFVLGYEGSELVACVAIWDQLAFKQTVVEAYRAPLAQLVPVYNGLAGLLGWPRLPRPHHPLSFVFLSHFAAKDNDPARAIPLLRAAVTRARERGFSFASIGFSQRHPLCAQVLQSFRHIEYRSDLFTVHWQGEEDAVQRLDDRVAHPEIAIL